jgi:hypothetical protein
MRTAVVHDWLNGMRGGEKVLEAILPRLPEPTIYTLFHTPGSVTPAIERDVGKTCKGPASALKTGREQAAKRTTSAERAWAMRDAFDGLLDVIDRGGAEL